MALPTCYTPRLVSFADKLADDRVLNVIFPYCFAKTDFLNALMGARLRVDARSRHSDFQ